MASNQPDHQSLFSNSISDRAQNLAEVFDGVQTFVELLNGMKLQLVAEGWSEHMAEAAVVSTIAGFSKGGN